MIFSKQVIGEIAYDYSSSNSQRHMKQSATEGFARAGVFVRFHNDALVCRGKTQKHRSFSDSLTLSAAWMRSAACVRWRLATTSFAAAAFMRMLNTIDRTAGLDARTTAKVRLTRFMRQTL